MMCGGGDPKRVVLKAINPMIQEWSIEIQHLLIRVTSGHQSAETSPD